MIISKPTLHTRADGSRYLLDVGEFTLQEGKVNAMVELFNGVAETLSQYKDTNDRAKNPDYLRGVLKGRVNFIEESRANEIYESLKSFPLGERAKASLVQQSLDEIPLELNKAMETYFEDWQFIRRDMKANISIDDDLVIVEGDKMCSVSIREGFMDELRASMTREVSNSEIEDNETFRKAIHLLWSLADKGYQLADSFSIAIGCEPVFLPSCIDKLMRKDVVSNTNGRDILITDDRLLNELRK